MPPQRANSKDAAKSPAVTTRVPRKPRQLGGGKGRAAPGKRGVGRNHTFKFRSSMYVAQRKSKSIQDYYQLEQELNEGAYGVVYKAIHNESGAERAVKKIEKSKWNPEENSKVIDEFNVLRGLDHPNILKMYELFEDDTHFYIVTDICKGGDLLDELEALEETGAFPEPEAAILMTQVLSSINYCHSNNLVHRDLKPENILLEANKALHEIKLIDFGFAVPCTATQTMAEQKGTAAYMSPQAMLEEAYGQKTDVWAVGVIAYIVLAGFNPFEGHTDPETAVLVEMGEYDFEGPEWDGISEEAKDFVTQCLHYEEKDRLTAAQALEHPWIQQARASMHSDFFQQSGASCQTSLHNLQKFHAHSKLKQATCTFIASQLISKDEKETIDKLFRSIDTDSDGKLYKDDVQKAYRDIFGETLSDQDVDELFQQVDLNGDGMIEYSEFVVASLNESTLLSHENLQKAFCMFDRDGDGFISRGDLRQVMDSFANKAGSDHAVEDVIIDKFMDQIDTSDATGKISFEEFKESMFKVELAGAVDGADEDKLMEEAKREAKKMVDRSDSGTSGISNASSRITARSALQVPRRRRPSAAEEMVQAVKSGKSKNKELLRTASGNSEVSHLSDDEESVEMEPLSDVEDDKTPPPAPPRSNSNSPAGARPGKKKGITRTKSGFMTQRADNQAPRKGRKPGNARSASPVRLPNDSRRAAALPSDNRRVLKPTSSAGSASSMLDKFKEFENKKKSKSFDDSLPVNRRSPPPPAQKKKVASPPPPPSKKQVASPPPQAKKESPLKALKAEARISPKAQQTKKQDTSPKRTTRQISMDSATTSGSESSSSSSSSSSSGSSSSSNGSSKAAKKPSFDDKKLPPATFVTKPRPKAEKGPMPPSTSATSSKENQSTHKKNGTIHRSADVNLDSDTEEEAPDTNALRKIKQTKQDISQKQISLSKSSSQEEKPVKKKGLGDMLATLPSSKDYKKQQRAAKANPNSSSVSVPNLSSKPKPVQQRTKTEGVATNESGDSGGEDSAKPKVVSNSIRDRMNNFKGTGTFLPNSSNKNRLSPKKAKSADVKSLRGNYSDSDLLLDDSDHSTGKDGAGTKKRESGRRGRLQEEDNADSKPSTYTRAQTVPTLPAPDSEGDSGGELDTSIRTKNARLRDRMKLFEQNIQKNKDLGITKKIF